LLVLLFSFAFILNESFSKNLILKLILLSVPVFVALPLFAVSNVLITRQEALILLLVSNSKFHTSINNLELLLILPLIFLLLISLLSLLVKKTTPLFFVSIFIGTLIYLHIPYFPLDKSTYKIFFSLVVILLLLFFIFGLFLWRKLKIKLAKIILTFSTIFITLILLSIFSRQLFIIPSFEKNAIEFLQSRNEKVFYLNKNNLPIYKAVRPLTLDYPKIGRIFVEKWFVTNTFSENGLFLVPKFLGANSMEAISIFDNGNIQILQFR